LITKSAHQLASARKKPQASIFDLPVAEAYVDH